MQSKRMEPPVAAFVLSLIGGVVILLGSSVMMIWAYGGMPVWSGMMGGMGGMMNGYGGMMGNVGFSGTGFFTGMSLLGIITGVLVSIGAVMLYIRPEQASTWGIIILVSAIISFFGMGGFLVGALLGLVGGIIAVTWKPETTTSGGVSPR